MDEEHWTAPHDNSGFWTLQLDTDETPSFPLAGIRAGRLFCASARLKRKRRRKAALTRVQRLAQQRLYFVPEPQGQGSLRPALPVSMA